METRHLIGLLTGQVAKNMIGAFFFDLKAVNGGAARPPGVDVAPVRRVAVLGAGMMGAGIAYACASAGLDVVVKDVSPEAAGRAGSTPSGCWPARSARAAPPRRTPGPYWTGSSPPTRWTPSPAAMR
ncbi:hypothetical protein GCM10027614_42550 [Micromonospora vulcania]